MAVTIGGLVGLVALLLDAWSTRHWGAHPDRAWWFALGVVSLLTASGWLWLELAEVR